jgi:hypothetical protein
MRKFAVVGSLAVLSLAVFGPEDAAAKPALVKSRPTAAPTQVTRTAAPPKAPALVPAPAKPAGPPPFSFVPPAHVCVTAGKVTPVAANRINADVGGLRGVIAESKADVAEIAFTYNGPSSKTTPLASGEVRRQVGLKLRAMNTCNVIYIMWHIEPKPQIAVSVKYNPGMTLHSECGPNGYINLKPASGTQPPPIVAGSAHKMRAEIVDSKLRITADSVVAWEAPLPAEAFTLVGGPGLRSDNANFDFEYAIPGGTKTGASCDGVPKFE